MSTVPGRATGSLRLGVGHALDERGQTRDRHIGRAGVDAGIAVGACGYIGRGERQMSGKAMVEYFAPLKKWLDEQNKGEKAGW